MITDHKTAVSEMLGLFKTAWGGVRYVAYPTVPENRPSAKEATWARIYLKFAGGRGVTVGGPDGSKRFQHSGEIWVETFTPFKGGTDAAYDAAQIAINAFEGKRTASDVTFINVRMVDEGQGQGGDDLWWRVVTVAEFSYQTRN